MTEAPWDLARIRAHVAAHLPLAALMGIEIAVAATEGSRVRLHGNANVMRPGGSVAGPVLFAMADLVSYVQTVMLQQRDLAFTASLSIHFFRPPMLLPLIAEATTLRAGRTLSTFDVRIWSEVEGPAKLAAQATATWTAGARR
jgi:uncharacterized protein (TIGR00369 family)